jgi:hypothetical protein
VHEACSDFAAGFLLRVLSGRQRRQNPGAGSHQQILPNIVPNLLSSRNGNLNGAGENFPQMAQIFAEQSIRKPSAESAGTITQQIFAAQTICGLLRNLRETIASEEYVLGAQPSDSGSRSGMIKCWEHIALIFDHFFEHAGANFCAGILLNVCRLL